jgi:DNA polymerase III sliding clamp (beta) subunit (PCNA family)
MKFDAKYKPELCASKDYTRPMLAHVELDVEHKRMLATDGHRLVVVPVTIEDHDASGPISKEALVASRKATKNTNGDAWIKANGSLAVYGATLDRPAARQFPPVEQVIPKDRKATISFSAKYLKEIADALGSKDGVVTLGIDGDDEPIMVWEGKGKGSDGDPFAVLMPCRLK